MAQISPHTTSLPPKVDRSEDYKISVQELAANFLKEIFVGWGDKVEVLRGDNQELEETDDHEII